VTAEWDVAGTLREQALRIEEIVDDLDSPEARQELDEVVAQLRILILRHFGRKPRATHGEGARSVIRDYLHANVGRWIEGEELAVVSGIQEWARRVRELRVEEGLSIEEEDHRYCLRHSEPDRKTAAHWQRLQTIRHSGGSARDRVLTLLKSCVGEVVTREEIDYVANIKEGSRRLRELRDEFGWPIESYIDDPLLKPHQYRLASAADEDLTDPRQRLYPEDLRARIFKRDNYTCQNCHRDHRKAQAAGDSRFYLEVHHKTAVADELTPLSPKQLNSEENLITYCHACHRRETAEFQRQQRERRRNPR
jgi:5-methylcytosine-specific restriction endonuclease McrA